MELDLVQLGFGLGALIADGEAVVRGAESLALRLGIGPVLVGLTVVAFGTAAPGLVVNVAAALRGGTEIGGLLAAGRAWELSAPCTHRSR